MPQVTLVLSRKPHDEFLLMPSQEPTGWQQRDDVDDLSADVRGRLYRSPGTRLDELPNIKRQSGLWGTMAMIVGPRVIRANFVTPDQGALQQIERREMLTVDGRSLHLICSGDAITLPTKVYTTMERYRTDFGDLNEWDFGYVRMVAREGPYGLRVERNNPVVATLRTGHDGLCVRILGGETEQQRAILIHEGPNIGWVIGCIAPRPLGERGVYANEEGNASQQCVKEIVRSLDSASGVGELFVCST